MLCIYYTNKSLTLVSLCLLRCSLQAAYRKYTYDTIKKNLFEQIFKQMLHFKIQ